MTITPTTEHLTGLETAPLNMVLNPAAAAVSSYMRHQESMSSSHSSVSSGRTDPSQLPQRSPFGIQQLLGLGSGAGSPRSHNKSHESPSFTQSHLISPTSHHGIFSHSQGYPLARSPVPTSSHSSLLAQSGHCFSAADSARLAYLNSPAAAALMSASMHGPNSTPTGCVPGMSMFHSFGGPSVESLNRSEAGELTILLEPGCEPSDHQCLKNVRRVGQSS